jgi:hypothetical protein
MSLDSKLARVLVSLASLLAIVSACDNAPATVAPSRTEVSVHHSSHNAFGPDVNQQLAALRQLTAPFRDFDRAVAAGWSTQITSCLTDPSGAMGFHYGNTAYIDGKANLLEPELLMYEPESNGHLRFVGVEYIVPLALWTGATPPMLLGQEFQVNSAFGVWALHVWLGRENPSGVYANWNPKVSCRAAQ